MNSSLKEIFKKFRGGHTIQSTQAVRNCLSRYMPELTNGQQDAFDFFVALNMASDTDKESTLQAET